MSSDGDNELQKKSIKNTKDLERNPTLNVQLSSPTTEIFILTWINKNIKKLRRIKSISLHIIGVTCYRTNHGGL